MTDQPTSNLNEQIPAKKVPPAFNVPPITAGIIGLLVIIHVGLLFGGEQFQIWSQAVFAFNPARFGMEPINQLAKQHALRPEIVRRVPSVLERIDSQMAVDCMLDLLDHEDLSVHLEALRSLNNMKIQYPHLRFQKKAIMQRIMEEVRLYQNTLSVLYAQIKIGNAVHTHTLSVIEQAQEKARANLVKLLEARMDGHLERIFRLLGLKYPTEDILPIFQGLQSNKPDLRINAVEFLENLLDSSLKKVLIPVLETALLDGITAETIDNLDINIPDEFTCYTTLLEGKDVQLKFAVLYLLGQSKDPQFVPLIKKYGTSEALQIKMGV